MRIVFMGTPDFAVGILKNLVENGYNVVGVVTSQDKPAGRGQKIQFSDVKEFALKHNLKLLQPRNLKDESFLEELKTIKPDLQIVVAFRMLPKKVWSLPKYGTFNLHASLLPQYRGAAPINWAIINGEKITGVTTFFIDEQIDTGKIIFQESVEINDNESAGTLHDKLMILGADLVLRTIEAIKNNSVATIEQKNRYKEFSELKQAPKIYREDCKINWNKDLTEIYNLIRGLSPYPAAWTEIINKDDNSIIQAKIYDCEIEFVNHNYDKMHIETDNKNYLRLYLEKGFISFKSIQIQGKKQLNIKELLCGLNFSNKTFI